MKLHWQILIALLAAALVGVGVGFMPEGWQGPSLAVLDFFGTLFLNALPPLFQGLPTFPVGQIWDAWASRRLPIIYRPACSPS